MTVPSISTTSRLSDVIRGDAVGKRMRAAGILGDIAADGASALARGIRSVEVTEWSNGQRDIQIDDARLNQREFILDVDLENAVHAGERDHHSARHRNGPTAQASSRAPADKRKLVFRRNLDQADHLVRRAREDNDVRNGHMDAAIVFVELPIDGIDQNPCLPEQRLNCAMCFRDLAPYVNGTIAGSGRSL